MLMKSIHNTIKSQLFNSTEKVDIIRYSKFVGDGFRIRSSKVKKVSSFMPVTGMI